MAAPDLPVHISIKSEWLDSVGSTNEVAMQRGQEGSPGPLWIAAREQTGGRGRSGRSWQSPPGNLYCSLLLTYDRPLTIIAQLALVAGVAVHGAIAQMAPGISVSLKWPNDVLVSHSKIAGILIESQTVPGGAQHSVVIGIGINLAHHPALPDRQATSLAALGIQVSPYQVWQRLASAFEEWLAVWSAGEGFSGIRTAWEQRAVGIGSTVSVKSGGDVWTGRFCGLDDDGAMRLQFADGALRRITFGDVHIGNSPGARP